MTTYAVDGWTALGDPTRRTIFELVAGRPRAVGELASGLPVSRPARPRAVGELASGLPVSRPAVSQHLKVLKEAGLVSDRRNGNRRIYEVDRDGLGQLRADLDRFWTSALDVYKAAVELPPQEDKQ